MITHDQLLLDKIKSLPLERQAEVDEFVECFCLREEFLLKLAALRLEEPQFSKASNDLKECFDTLSVQ